MNCITKKIIIYLISIICIILGLYLIFFIIDNDIIFPSPYNILIALINLLKEQKTYIILGYSFLRLIISLLLSFLIGGTLGILAGKFNSFRVFIKPFMTILRSVPLASIIVIIIVILDFNKSPYVITLIMLIPIIYEAFLNGILNLDKDLMDVWKLESNMNEKVLINIIFPLAKPFITTAFIQSVGLGIKVLIMAEFICNTNNSIGKALVNSANYLEYDNVFAWTILAILFVIIIENIPKLINYIEKR